MNRNDTKGQPERAAVDGAALSKIRNMLGVLLGPEGCPWDKEQSLDSLCNYALEEMYELVDAMRNGGPQEQREELGDVFFILLFMAALEEKAGRFSLADVLDENYLKMTSRHPHVFGDKPFTNYEDLSDSWEAIKKAEKAKKASKTGVFGTLPVALPPLIKAYRIHSKSASNHFTWDTDDDALQQVEAEWLEWLDACEHGSQDEQEHEFGDLLFSLVELGRRRGVKAAAALERTNVRYLARFAAMETLAAKRGLDFSALAQDEKDALWTEIKAAEKKEQAVFK